jgi:hypothetical protein
MTPEYQNMLRELKIERLKNSARKTIAAEVHPILVGFIHVANCLLAEQIVDLFCRGGDCPECRDKKGSHESREVSSDAVGSDAISSPTAG